MLVCVVESFCFQLGFEDDIRVLGFPRLQALERLCRTRIDRSYYSASFNGEVDIINLSLNLFNHDFFSDDGSHVIKLYVHATSTSSGN
jgi:hypothetical protein